MLEHIDLVSMFGIDISICFAFLDPIFIRPINSGPFMCMLILTSGVKLKFNLCIFTVRLVA